MKGLLIIAIAVAAGIGSYEVYFWTATAPTAAMLFNPDGEMEWLKREYHLTDAQFARIRQLHREYAPKCELMCEKIASANGRLGQLIKANRTLTPEMDTALNECMVVQSECRRALFGHVYAVSTEMSPENGARYVEMMKERILEPALGHQTAISRSAKQR